MSFISYNIMKHHVKHQIISATAFLRGVGFTPQQCFLDSLTDDNVHFNRKHFTQPTSVDDQLFINHT